MENKFDLYTLLYLYFKFEYLFDERSKYEELGWGEQIYVLRILSLLRAFTGESLSTEDLANIGTLIDSCFGRGYEDCSDSIIEELKQIFPNNRLLDRCKKNVQEKRNFYDFIYRTVRSGHRYINLFSGVLCAPLGFSVVDDYKIRNIDSVIVKHIKILVDAMKIILGGDFRKSFSLSELQECYGYPLVSDEELFEWMCDNI